MDAPGKRSFRTIARRAVDRAYPLGRTTALELLVEKAIEAFGEALALGVGWGAQRSLPP
jgi:hypothetical protein